MAIAKRFPSDKADQYIVRFPTGMRDRIKALAASNGRSMNSQIIQMLEFALDETDMAAHAVDETDEKKAISLFLRDEIRRRKKILESILDDYESGKLDIEPSLDASENKP